MLFRSVERFYRTLYESLLDPRLITSSKHALYLNLLFRSLKADLNIKRVKAFTKRLLQIITLHQPPFICGVLYLIRELETTFPGLASMITDPEEGGEDDEEVFRDVPEESDPTAQEPERLRESLVHPDRAAQEPRKEGAYDGRKRDPEHSNAEKSCLWELLPFIQHFHPSVAMFADRLLQSAEMGAKPDLASHSLISFLDRFVYRNAKASSSGLRGSSIMQPLAGGESRGVLVANRAAAHAHEPVNSEAFWRKKAEDVNPDEVFFHQYFSQVGKSKQSTKKKAEKKKKGEDESGDEEDENEDEIWQALVDSRPEVEGPSDDDSDLEMLDLDDSGEDGEGDWSDDDEVDVEGSDDEVDVEGSDEEGEGEEASPFSDEEMEEAEGSEDDEDEDALFEKELQTNKEPEVVKEETGRQKKKKMKGLPMFASMEDYASMLDGDEDEDLG